MRTADDYRAMWDTIERLWSDPIALAEQLPDEGACRPTALVCGIVDGLTDAELERICTRAPAPGYPEVSGSVGDCVGVVMEEECEHHRFAVRDLAVLEAPH